MKNRMLLMLSVIVSAAAVTVPAAVLAQQPQIPTLQVCNPTAAKGFGTVFLAGRQFPPSGTFTITQFELRCDPLVSPYPTGVLSMKIDLTDSSIIQLDAVTFEQVTTTGKHTPTTYMNGRCKALDVNGEPVRGCRFWLMAADNVDPKTPDIVGFLVFDATGVRISYGTGPLVEGNIYVAPTPF